jgi:hypothetical protein
MERPRTHKPLQKHQWSIGRNAKDELLRYSGDIIHLTFDIADHQLFTLPITGYFAQGITAFLQKSLLWAFLGAIRRGLRNACRLPEKLK